MPDDCRRDVEKGYGAPGSPPAYLGIDTIHSVKRSIMGLSTLQDSSKLLCVIPRIQSNLFHAIKSAMPSLLDTLRLAALPFLAPVTHQSHHEPQHSVSSFDNLPARLFFFGGTLNVIFHDALKGNELVCNDEGKSWKDAEGQAENKVVPPWRTAQPTSRQKIEARPGDHSTHPPLQLLPPVHSPSTLPQEIRGHPLPGHPLQWKWLGKALTRCYISIPKGPLSYTNRCQLARSSKDFKYETLEDLVYCVSYCSNGTYLVEPKDTNGDEAWPTSSPTHKKWNVDSHSSLHATPKRESDDEDKCPLHLQSHGCMLEDRSKVKFSVDMGKAWGTFDFGVFVSSPAVMIISVPGSTSPQPDVNPKRPIRASARSPSFSRTSTSTIKDNPNWRLTIAVRNDKDKFGVIVKAVERPLQCATIPSRPWLESGPMRCRSHGDGKENGAVDNVHGGRDIAMAKQEKGADSLAFRTQGIQIDVYHVGFLIAALRSRNSSSSSRWNPSDEVSSSSVVCRGKGNKNTGKDVVNLAVILVQFRDPMKGLGGQIVY
ncbi:hypothetical protein BKA70DRAFT_1410326 [Coprinopsis sp. MPI-PUGE-AT-0042]|nr:hypothetical protein BKA70DRAFT_1410326 [Coprinopsis sp. MPI-PUGE-AT-0042]